MKTFVAFCLGGLCAAALIWGTARVREQKCRQRAVAAQAKAAVAEKKVPDLAVKPGDYPEPLDLEPWVTRSGTLQLNSGHVQGACVSKDAVYMTLHNGIYKYDWRGNLLKSVPAEIHQGDICYSKGKLYVSVAVQIKKAGEPEGRIDVYDADLNFLTNAVFAKPADGITCMNGVLYVGLGPARVKNDPYCGSWYGTFDEKTLRPLMKPRLVRHGSEVCAGVQNICNDGEKLYVQVYTPEMGTPCFLIFDKDFNLLGSDVFGWRNGLDIVNWKGKPYFIYFSTLSNGKHFPPVQALMRYAELNPYGKLTDISDWCYFISPSGRYKEFYRRDKKPTGQTGEADSFGYATWNVGHFALGLSNTPAIVPGDVPKRAADYRKFLSEAKADVLGVCEHTTFFSSDKKAKAADTAFADYDGQAVGPFDKGHSNGFYWKKGIVRLASGHFDFPVRNAPCYCEWVRLSVDGREVCLVETHCDWNTAEPGHEADRAEQMRFLIQTFGSEPRVVISGDFNSCVRDPKTGKWTDAPKEFEVFRKAGFSAAHWGELRTWPAKAPALAIDNVFVKGLKVSDVKVLPDQTLSDHALLRCTLTFLDGRKERKEK